MMNSLLSVCKELPLVALMILPHLSLAQDELEDDLLPEKDIQSVCETMCRLDKSLTKLYEELPMDEGDELLKQHRTYNQACRLLLQYCQEDQKKAFTAARDLLERGGPEFLDVDIQLDRMEHRFNWNGEEVQEMKDEVKKTNTVWYDMQRTYNNIPTNT